MNQYSSCTWHGGTADEGDSGLDNTNTTTNCPTLVKIVIPQDQVSDVLEDIQILREEWTLSVYHWHRSQTAAYVPSAYVRAVNGSPHYTNGVLE